MYMVKSIRESTPPCLTPLEIENLLEREPFKELEKAGVRWNGSLSNKFSVSNGVRHGGVLSPVKELEKIDLLSQHSFGNPLIVPRPYH